MFHNVSNRKTYSNIVTKLKNQITIDPKMIIKREIVDYKLNKIPQTKEYTLRAHLFENGTVFTKGYLIADDDSYVNLQKIERQGRLDQFVRYLRNIIKR